MTAAGDISAIQASIKVHVTNAIGDTNWNIRDGTPRGYTPPQCNIWWQGIRTGAPMEVQEVNHTFIIRLVANSESDPDRQDLVAVGWEAIFLEWTDPDAISCSGEAQLSFPSSAEPIEVVQEGVLYVGIDITVTVIVKEARIFV